MRSHEEHGLELHEEIWLSDEDDEILDRVWDSIGEQTRKQEQEFEYLIGQLEEALQDVRDSFDEGELAYKSMNCKLERGIQERLAWKLQQRFDGRYVVLLDHCFKRKVCGSSNRYDLVVFEDPRCSRLRSQGVLAEPKLLLEIKAQAPSDSDVREHLESDEKRLAGAKVPGKPMRLVMLIASRVATNPIDEIKPILKPGNTYRSDGSWDQRGLHRAGPTKEPRLSGVLKGSRYFESERETKWWIWIVGDGEPLFSSMP